MSVPIVATIEEFESGTWVADLVLLEAFDGSFDLGGATWTGTVFSERLDRERYHTRVVGGGGGLATVLRDKFYSGSVAVTTAVGDIAREASETIGTVSPKFMSNFERIKGTAAQGLDSLALAFGMLWWIGRDGKINMKTARDTGSAASGSLVSQGAYSATLVQPADVTIGGTYDAGDGVAKTIRHVRWFYTSDHFEAELYFLPFVFRNPVQNKYDSLDSASVDRQNADGTLDVIVAGRYGVTKVPLYAGIPGAKLKVNGGESVMLGYFGGDPQKPFCVSVAQDLTAVHEVARKMDSVNVGTLVLAYAGPGALSGSYVAPDGTTTAIANAGPPIMLAGQISSGSSRVKLGD